MQPRPLEPRPDLCCLPSPRKIPQGIAGMAFNFSRIEMAHYTSARNAPVQAGLETTDEDTA
jgi:hypothetical protein